jgi:hypothetical protein
LQMQFTLVCCTTTCIAMAVGTPVGELGVDLDTAYGFKDCGIWLAERGIWLRMCDRAERFRPGTVYLVSVRSLNRIGGDHALLLDTRPGASNDDDSEWLTFDPNTGIEGKKVYNFVNEHYAVHACELKQHDGRHQRFGSPP